MFYRQHLKYHAYFNQDMSTHNPLSLFTQRLPRNDLTTLRIRGTQHQPPKQQFLLDDGHFQGIITSHFHAFQTHTLMHCANYRTEYATHLHVGLSVSSQIPTYSIGQLGEIIFKSCMQFVPSIKIFMSTSINKSK